MVGLQMETTSYQNIQLTLGVDSAADVLFLTDVAAEADAAAAAGWQVALVVRPGNAPLPPECRHRTIHSLEAA